VNNAVEVVAEARRSALAQDTDYRKAGMLGFALPDVLREGPLRMRFEFGADGFSRIRLGLLV
jgi:hypothetical protein